MTRAFLWIAVSAMALLPLATAVGAERCEVAGPQAPRDLGQPAGQNPRTFDFADDTTQMSLCNIHFHKFAEHRSEAYSLQAGEGDHHGWACQAPPTHKAAAPTGPTCDGVGLGDTIEVHWVFTSCATGPGEGLGNCVSCPEEGRNLRVEARVFVLAEDGADFADFDYQEGSEPAQPRSLPAAGSLVQYLGSTTGPSYDDVECSPFSVAWSVSPECSPLALGTLHSWCGEGGDGNAFGEDHAHGVRELVTDPGLLSDIR